MEQPALGSTVSVVSSTPFPASTAAMEDPRMNKSRVEKLKRRIIRVVAGKLSQNPDEKEINKMWEAMKKSCKCDCKLLWKHMRAVTVKKLKRLISADDRVEEITDIARLTITDWLLYDLVLAHEDIDVIGQEIWDKTGEEPEPLIELFFLVDEYHIEKLEGTQLIEAWLNLTREYNDSGRKCSPMLLQRRWYQLKQATRKAFYLFWGNFRGNTVHFQRAVKYKPTALQVDIARKYRNLILTSFPDWNELIKKKKVILAHEFDNYITMSRLNKNKDEGPDLELIEQKIDTIDLEDDSDTEKSNDVATPTQVSANRTIKCDPENIYLTHVDDKDIHFLKEMNIPCETPFANYDDTNLVIDCGEVFSNTESRDANDSCQDQAMEVGSDSHHSLDDNDINLKMLAMVENNKENDNNLHREHQAQQASARDDSNFHENVGSEDSNAVYGESTITCDDSSDGDIAEITDIFNPSQIKIETPFFSDTDVAQTRSVKNVIERSVENDKFEEDQENIETVCEESNLQLNDINESKETFHILPKIQSVTSINSDFSSTTDTYKNILAQKATELDLSRSKSSNKHFSNDLVIKELTKSIEESTVKDIELLGNYDEIPKDLLFVDDGIALDDEDEVAVNVEENNYNEKLSSEDKMSTIDLKLLLFSTVYTKKLDHMDVFRFIEFDNIRDKRIIKCAEIESKPKNLLAYNLEDISKNKEQTVKKDIDSSDLEDNLLSAVPNYNVKKVNIIKTEYPLNEDTVNDSEHHSNQNEIPSEEDDESLLLIKNRVDIQNNMFKKPHVQNYNPIQLCKNPDFNTRLKRLTAGFLSYEKNREYLKRCHPVTIDLHKTFELNLIDNIMYLDESTVNTNKPSIETQGSDPKEGQHNTNNTRASIEVEERKSFDGNISLDTKNHNADKSSSVITSTSTPCERNKVINLPDISEIRRVNKNLVTAEVAPLQIVINTPSEGKTIKESFSNLKNEDIFTATSTVTGSNIDKQICDNVDPILVNETNAINKVACVRDEVYKTIVDNKNDKNANKRKIQQKKPYNYAKHYLPWNRPVNFAKEEECLLASDTVDKMLALFSGQEIKSNNKNTQGLKRKPRLEAVKKSNEICKKDRKVLERTKINNTDDDSNNDNNLQTGVTEDALAVLSISQKRKKKEFCCWAQKKIMYPNLKRKHSCKRPLCTCCCKDKLLEKYKKALAQSKPTNKPNPTAALTLSYEKVPNQTTAITLSDEEVPNQTATSTLSDEEVLNQPNEKRKFVVNIPTAAKSPPKQTTNSVPSIVIDGNTNIINVPKFIVRHQTPKVIEKVAKLPNISKIPSSTPNTNIHSVEANDTNTPIHKNRLTIKRNLTNTENIHTLRKSNINVQQGCQDVMKPRSRIKFYKSISQKTQTVSAQLNNEPTNTVTLNVKKGSSASPIFLGQNKILLSTVRGPMAKPIPIDTPKIILPQGVCFVLLPNNELVLSIASGVDLATEELRHLEFVIQALQRVLGKPKTREHPVSDCAKEDMDNKEATDKNNHNIFSKNKEDTDINLSVNEDPKKTLTANEKVQNIDSPVSNIDLELSKESVDTENPSIDTNRKTILSDLMEMSGISPEDAKLPEPSILPLEPNIPCDNKTGTSEMHPDLLHLFNNPIAVAALARRPDLSILTTYSDLRYASDNNGKFFKMDVCTGEIVRINVFIKKKDKLINKREANPVDNQEPIDLTSDKDSCNESDDNTLVSSIMIPAAKKNKGVDGIKPLKLFRAMNSSLIKQNDTVQNTNMKVYSGPMMVGNSVLKIVNLGKRKLNLNQGIKVDMNNVTGDAKDSNQGVAATINLDESDSDDEPLAKKANRNREEELNYAINSEATNNDAKGCEMPMDADLDYASVVYEEIENEFESIEEAGEDCILGV